MRLTIIIPTLNEERSLPAVLSRIPLIPEISEILLVDGRSSDGTTRLAQQLMPRIKIVYQPNSGKGDAIVYGAQVATGDYFMVLDADGSQQPEEIPLFVAKAREGYDLVKGSRYMIGGRSDEDTWDRKIATRIAQVIANFLWRTNFTDICYGMFLIDRKKFLTLAVESRRHDIEWEMMIRAHRRGLRIVEIPSYEAKRIAGHSHLSYLRDGWLIGRAVLREFVRGVLRAE